MSTQQQSFVEIPTTADRLRMVAKRWWAVKQEADRLHSQAQRLRDEAGKLAEKFGQVGDDGHQRAFFPPIECGDKTCSAIKRELHVRKTPSQERAWALAVAKGVEDELFPLVRTFDEAALYQLCQAGVIDDEQLDALYDVRRSFAIMLMTS